MKGTKHDKLEDALVTGPDVKENDRVADETM